MTPVKDARVIHTYSAFSSLRRRRRRHPHRLLDIVATNCLPIKCRRLTLVGRESAAFLLHIR